MDNETKTAADTAVAPLPERKKAYLIQITGTERGEVRTDKNGEKYGYAYITYVTKRDNKTHSTAAMARGKALQDSMPLFQPESYAGPAYGVFENSDNGRKFSVINTLPAPTQRAAA